MSKKVNLCKKKIPANVKNPIYYQIEDGDIDTINYYRNNGVPICRKAFKGKPAHLYALVEADTQAQADAINRALGNTRKHEMRQCSKINKSTTSYEQLLESGFNPPADDKNPSDIVEDLAIVKALLEEVSRLTAERHKIAMMIADEKTEREMATELGIPQTTLHGRKVKTLKQLSEALKNFK